MNTDEQTSTLKLYRGNLIGGRFSKIKSIKENARSAKNKEMN
jgi:hypothetical protein